MQGKCKSNYALRQRVLDLGYGKFKRLWFILRDNHIVNMKPKDSSTKLINNDLAINELLAKMK